MTLNDNKDINIEYNEMKVSNTMSLMMKMKDYDSLIIWSPPEKKHMWVIDI